jgi:hypothetical protein
VKLAARRKDCAPLLQSSLVTRCWRELDSNFRFCDALSIAKGAALVARLIRR